MVVLYFYPRDDTSGCTTEACGFRDSYDALKAAGVEVSGVSDADKTVAIAYGAWGEKLVRGRPVVGMKRMTFLIDAAGTIQRIWSTVKPAGHAAEVLEYVRKVQQ